MARTCENFKIGDIVSFGFIPNHRFYGTVLEVCPKENKVYVDVNGKTSQFDPDEIMVVLEKAVGRIARRGKSVKALYWAQTPRKYKRTQDEMEKNESRCPKCKCVMDVTRFTKNNKLHVCPECDFKIPSNDIVFQNSTPVSNIVDEIRANRIVKKLAQSPLRTRRDYGESEMVKADDYEYHYDPDHKTKPSGGGWEKTDKGWQKGKQKEEESKGTGSKPSETPKKFNEHSDSWFDGAMIDHDEIDEDRDVLKSINKIMTSKPSTQNTLNAIVEQVDKLKNVDAETKNKIKNHVEKIKNNSFKDEFKNQYGGNKGDGVSSSAKEFINQLHQALFYNIGYQVSDKKKPKIEKPVADLSDLETDYKDEPEEEKYRIKQSRIYFTDMTGRQVKDVLEQGEKMKKLREGENDGNKWQNMEYITDSVWKGYLKTDPKEMADGAQLYVDSGKFTHKEVDDYLAYGEAKAKARLDTLKEKKHDGYTNIDVKNNQKFYDQQIKKYEGTVKEWQDTRKIFNKGKKTEEKTNVKNNKPARYKKLSPKKGTLNPVQDILKTHELTDDSDEVKEIAGFKKSIENNQMLTQKAVEKKKAQGDKFWPRNSEKLKAEFIKNMDSGNYSSPEAFKKAQERMKKMPAQDFAKILAAISAEDEEV